MRMIILCRIDKSQTQRMYSHCGHLYFELCVIFEDQNGTDNFKLRQPRCVSKICNKIT